MRNSDNFETQTASGLCVLLLRFADLDQSFTQSVVAPCFICRSDRQSVIFSDRVQIMLYASLEESNKLDSCELL